MKKFIPVFALIVFSCSLAQAATTSMPTVKHPVVVNATPPTAVLVSFRNIFGVVPVREWKLRSNGTWRAHFMRNGIAWEATFTATGVLVKSERD